MALFIRKQKADILREALRKLETKSPISAVSPGSVARAFTEAITTELGDYYDAMDFQVAQTVITSASGSALDSIGNLYNTKRRTTTEITTIDRRLGSFYFYLDTAHSNPITIPVGTQVYTSTDSFVGRQLRYTVTDEVTIPIGSTRAFASIKPDFSDAIFTAAPGTLVVHSFASPPGAVVRCTNPKAIAPQEGYESDENYRVRIIKSVRVAAGGTYDAVRFAALGIVGVRDVRIQENIYGLGSFRVMITPEDYTFTATTAEKMRESLNRVRPLGTRMFIAQPDLIPVDITVTVMLKGSSRTNSEVIIRTVNIAAKRYLNSLLAGDTLVYNRLIQYILDANSDIQDVQFTKYAPNGREALRKNYTPKEDQMLVPGAIGVNIATL